MLVWGLMFKWTVCCLCSVSLGYYRFKKIHASPSRSVLLCSGFLCFCVLNSYSPLWLGLYGVFETKMEISVCLSIYLFYLSHSNKFVIALKSLKQSYKRKKTDYIFLMFKKCSLALVVSEVERLHMIDVA